MPTKAQLLLVPQLVNEQDFPRVPQQARSRTKRDAMLAAALALFGECGYEAVRIEEIATRANSGVGTFYAYFRSKQQLLLVLMQRYLETMLALDLLTVDRTQSLRAIISHAVHRAFVPDRAYAGLWRAWREAVAVDPHLSAIDRQITAWMDTNVVVLIENLATLAPLRSDLDCQATATVINATLLQLSQQPFFQSDALLEAAAKMIYHTLFVESD
jgi:AcrR family transcriptional regulator